MTPLLIAKASRRGGFVWVYDSYSWCFADHLIRVPLERLSGIAWLTNFRCTQQRRHANPYEEVRPCSGVWGLRYVSNSICSNLLVSFLSNALQDPLHMIELLKTQFLCFVWLWILHVVQSLPYNHCKKKRQEKRMPHWTTPMFSGY